MVDEQNGGACVDFGYAWSSTRSSNASSRGLVELVFTKTGLPSRDTAHGGIPTRHAVNPIGRHALSNPDLVETAMGVAFARIRTDATHLYPATVELLMALNIFLRPI